MKEYLKEFIERAEACLRYQKRVLVFGLNLEDVRVIRDRFDDYFIIEKKYSYAESPRNNGRARIKYFLDIRENA